MILNEQPYLTEIRCGSNYYYDVANGTCIRCPPYTYRVNMSEPDTYCTPVLCNGQPYNASDYPLPEGNV